MNPKKRFALKLIIFIAIAVSLTAFLGLAYAASLAKNLPNPEQIINSQVNQSTKIYDRTGKTLLTEVHGEENRTVIPFSEIPDVVKKATLAIEDQNFYNHPAFDWRGMLRAFWTNMVHGRVVQGGSTITQQLAKKTFLTPEKTYSRKIKELILALWIEKRYSKDDILGMYLNKIPYGSNAYGIEAAAKTFFNKRAKDLNISEAAALAAISNAPSYYSPWGAHQAELERRKNYVLELMAKLGFIDEEEKTSTQVAKLEYSKPEDISTKAPHFVVMVKDYLAAKYGEDVVENGGLQVTTSIDLRMQETAETAVKEGAEKNTVLYKGYNASLVAEDPKTGQILAMVGSKNYFGEPEPAGCTPGDNCMFEGNFNVAAQGLRQPGSTFKPFAYLTAFQKGYSPDTIVFDLPTEFSSDPSCPKTNINYNSDNPTCFHPENFDNTFRGPVSLKKALAESINVPAVKTLYLVGLKNTIDTATALGITTLGDLSRYGLSLVLGGGEVKLVDMVSAYSVFANEGTKYEQSFILEIKDVNGKVLEKFDGKSENIFDPEYVKELNNILTDANARSPLFQSSLSLTTFPGREVALKTGTTNSYKDAWAMGYTPSLVVGVWVGNNNSKPMQKQGGSILAAVPIWSRFLNDVLPQMPVETFNKPERAALPDKPMLNGNYISEKGIHDILYFIDKNNPLGDTPQDPQADPQFWNWELPVEIWLSSGNR